MDGKVRKYNRLWQVVTKDTKFNSHGERYGVYMIELRNPLTNRGKIIYVGETSCISTRIATHGVPRQEKKTMPDNMEIRFLFLECSGLDRCKLEKHFIRLIKPKYNFAGTRNKTEIGSKIKTALDGRTLRWLSERLMIPSGDMSLKMRGFKEFSKNDIERINELLGCRIEK